MAKQARQHKGVVSFSSQASRLLMDRKALFTAHLRALNDSFAE
jgi:hypothetical protein